MHGTWDYISTYDLPLRTRSYSAASCPFLPQVVRDKHVNSVAQSAQDDSMF
jgi:hypothetical protein